jgi:hypothetical protein
MVAVGMSGVEAKRIKGGEKLLETETDILICSGVCVCDEYLLASS